MSRLPLRPALLSGLVLLGSNSLIAGPRIAGGETTLSATVQVSESSNVSPRAGSRSDTSYSFIPSIAWNRSSNRMDMSANLSLPFTRYDSVNALDSNSVNFNLNGEIPFGAGPRFSGNWNVSYFEGIQSNLLTNRNLESENLAFSVKGDYVLARKLSFRSSFSVSDRESGGVGESDFRNANETTEISAGFHARDLIRGRIGAYVTYRIQERKTKNGRINLGVDDKDEGLNFGFTGQLLPERLFPKLDADLSFGFASSAGGSRRSGSEGDSGRRNRLTLDGRLAYPLNAKTGISLNYKRNLTVTDDDRTVEQTSLNLSVNYKPQQRLSFGATIGLSNNEFLFDDSNREDDVTNFSLFTTYQIRRNWSTRASLTTRDSSSNNSISDFSSNVLSLSTTISY